MIDKVRSIMKEYGMFPENGNIVAGVSGGADSVCLLRVLVTLRELYGWKLTAVHVNHRIRQEAGEDAAFVRRLCESWNVPFVLVEEDVEALAAREHLSCEEAGRRVRYEAFEKVMAQMDEKHLEYDRENQSDSSRGGRKQTGCIAVAHNSDDRAETLLFHLFRGTGLNGMAGIRPVRKLENGCRIIRPLLFFTRDEIEFFLKNEGIIWCTDATNAEDLYTRNRIRNRILPYAQQYISERAKEHLAKEAQFLAETSDFVERMTADAMGRCCKRTEGGKLLFERALFQEEDPFLQQQMVFKGLLEVGTGKDLTSAHVEQAMRLFAPECQSGKKVEVPSCRVGAARQFEQVVVYPIGQHSVVDVEGPVFLKEGKQNVPGLGEIIAEIIEISEYAGCEDTFLQDIPEKKYTKWFDYDKILESAVFRSRQTGDYLTINAAGAEKSLKRYLIEEKIPADRRDSLIFLADGAHVMWVPGHRISAAYKVTAHTKRVLQVCHTGGKEDDREN